MQIVFFFGVFFFSSCHLFTQKYTMRMIGSAKCHTSYTGTKFTSILPSFRRRFIKMMVEFWAKKRGNNAKSTYQQKEAKSECIETDLILFRFIFFLALCVICFAFSLLYCERVHFTCLRTWRISFVDGRIYISYISFLIFVLDVFPLGKIKVAHVWFGLSKTNAFFLSKYMRWNK